MDREGGGDLGSLVFAASCSGGDASPTLSALYDAALDFCAALLQGPRLAARESAGRLLSLEGGHQAATQVILDVCPRADPSFLDRSPHVLDMIKTFPEPWDDGLVEVFQRRTMTACSSDREGFSRGTWAHRRSELAAAGEAGRPVKTEHVTLHSSINMLEGNTGCHCWEAAFVLYEFVRSTSESFRNKLCLELGAGCGLVGVGLRRAGARTAVLTDANEDTLVNLAENLELNGIEPRSVDVSLGLKALGDGEVCYGRWCWEDEIADSSLDVDVVLGSDITYDVELVPSLVSVIRRLLYAKKSCAAYIAAMPRNPATLDAFVAEVEAKGMEIRLLPWKPNPSFWLRPSPGLSSVKLFHITPGM